MKITLLRTGGMLPVTKKAERDVPWSEQEFTELIGVLSGNEETAGKMRDSTDYHLKCDDKTFPINWNEIPLKYKQVFEDLKDDLKVVKPGQH